jgi:hypothetical protein
VLRRNSLIRPRVKFCGVRHAREGIILGRHAFEFNQLLRGFRHDCYTAAQCGWNDHNKCQKNAADVNFSSFPPSAYRKCERNSFAVKNIKQTSRNLNSTKSSRKSRSLAELLKLLMICNTDYRAGQNDKDVKRISEIF